MTTLTIPRRFGGEPITVEIDCPEDATFAHKVSLAVRRGAYLSGAYLYGADLSGANLYRADLSGADLSGANLYRANLYRAYLCGAYLSGASLSGADLSGADLSGANLSGANLYGADLSGANLSGAYLSGANLYGANLYSATIRNEPVASIIASVNRLAGPYAFLAFRLQDGTVKIMAGCRWFTPSEFRDHVAREYPGTPKAAETLAIIDFIELRATALGAVQHDQA